MTRGEFRFRSVGWAGSVVLRVLGASWRVSVHHEGPLREFRRAGQPVILAHWHSRILPLAYLHRGEGIVVLVSEHGDGEYITRVIERMGFGTGRGSSTRGGVQGLRSLLRAHRSGRDLGFAPDGPRGPARSCKPGVIVAAQLTGAPIVPLAAGGKALWRVGSWDRLVIPKPFAGLQLTYGEPLFVPRDATPEDVERAAARLEAELDRITDTADGVRPARTGSTDSHSTSASAE